MAIKKLQNDFTTPEQSKRLLELGVPADSADCYAAKNGVGIPTIGVLQEKYTSYARRTVLYGVSPCWSVGRLIEIYNTCVNFDLDDGAAIVIFTDAESPIAQMMEMFEDKVNIIDFSKLED